jgi:asparagine synthase (glutamine-hydrolysing)
VADLALSLPDALKVHGLTRKRLLRRAAAPLLPDAVLNGKKRGFTMPLAAWMRGDLEPFTREVLSAENLRRQGVFRVDAVTRMLDDHVAGRGDQSRKIWALLAFSLWFDRYAAGPAA